MADDRKLWNRIAGPEAARQSIEAERNNSFLWIGDLSNLLASYEGQRDKYPTLESFMPRVVRLFNDEASRIAELQRQYDESRPKIVSISVANHSEDVDPNVTQIVIQFDRPMRSAPSSDHPGDPRFSQSRFDASGKVLTIGVSLLPSRQYRFELAWPSGAQLVSAEGVPLPAYVIAFRTREANGSSAE